MPRPKIAPYPFTTLEPNLGVARIDDDTAVVLADIPGLIEGASQGAGLGHDFLRHIQRTRVLIHLSGRPVGRSACRLQPDQLGTGALRPAAGRKASGRGAEQDR